LLFFSSSDTLNDLLLARNKIYCDSSAFFNLHVPLAAYIEFIGLMRLFNENEMAVDLSRELSFDHSWDLNIDS
jgi:hypothetical protein